MFEYLSNNINNIIKVNSKEELVQLLKQYEGILSHPMIDYLNSLIELEFSIIRNDISDSDRLALSELNVYKKVAIYNIYNRALNIFKQNDQEFKILGNEIGLEKLSVFVPLSNGSVQLFDFDYSEGPIRFNNKIPYGYRTMKIGEIRLYKTLEDEYQREQEMAKVLEALDGLYNANNSYSFESGVIGGPATQDYFKQIKKVDEYERKFEELKNRKYLSDDDKKKIEITASVQELFLEDYGLTEDDFIPKKCFYTEPKSMLEKTLVKKMPNLVINNIIKYL